MVAAAGAVGAFVSNIFRLNDYNPDISSNKFISRVDGILRIIYGLSTASLVYIGIKANIIFGFLNTTTENNIYGYLFIAAIAGASERLFPSIVKQLEDKET